MRLISRNYDPTLIFGLGTLAKCASQYFNDDSQQGIVRGYTVDPQYVQDCKTFGTNSDPIVPFEKQAIDDFFQGKKPRVFLAIGYNKRNRLREEKFYQCKDWGFEVASFIHSSAVIARDAKIGDGVWIQEHCNIQNDVTIGDGCILWASSHVGHSANLESFVYQTTNSTICGDCYIEKNTFIAANSVIFPRVRVGNHNIIGAGAIISKDTAPNQVYDYGKDNLVTR